MGALYWYYCRKCKFSIESEGRECMGFIYQGKCFKCEECGSINDLVTSQSDFNTDEWWDVVPTCSRCKSTNVIEWDFKCPTCEIKMSRKRYAHIHED